MSESLESPESPTDICSICLNRFDEATVCETQCHHRFCKTCLDEWFNKHQMTCPLCRTQIQYFTCQGSVNRVVCIYRRMATSPMPVIPNHALYLVSRRNMIMLNVFAIFSFASLALSLGYWLQCDGCNMPCEPCGDEDPCNYP